MKPMRHVGELKDYYHCEDVDPLLAALEADNKCLQIRVDQLEADNEKWRQYFACHKARVDLLEENARLRKFIAENIPVQG